MDAHYETIVRDFLKENFDERIGRRVPSKISTFDDPNGFIGMGNPQNCIEFCHDL